jgi:hypothetical protein
MSESRRSTFSLKRGLSCFQKGHHAKPQEVPLVGVLPIGRVLHEGDGAAAGIVGDLGAVGPKERPDERAAPDGDGRKAVEARSLHHAQEEGLHLVVPVVAEGDTVVVKGVRHLLEEAVAHLPARVLDREAVLAGIARHIQPIRVEGHAEPPGQAAREILVPVRLLVPQPVVHVADGETEPEVLPDCVEHEKEGRGVDAPGDGHEDPIAGAYEVFLGDGEFYRCVEVMHVVVSLRGAVADGWPATITTIITPPPPHHMRHPANGNLSSPATSTPSTPTRPTR